MPIALIRDLTDALYHPARPPYVRHEEDPIDRGSTSRSSGCTTGRVTIYSRGGGVMSQTRARYQRAADHERISSSRPALSCAGNLDVRTPNLDGSRRGGTRFSTRTRLSAVHAGARGAVQRQCRTMGSATTPAARRRSSRRRWASLRARGSPTARMAEVHVTQGAMEEGSRFSAPRLRLHLAARSSVAFLARKHAKAVCAWPLFDTRTTFASTRANPPLPPAWRFVSGADRGSAPTLPPTTAAAYYRRARARLRRQRACTAPAVSHRPVAALTPCPIRLVERDAQIRGRSWNALLSTCMRRTRGGLHQRPRDMAGRTS